MWRIFGAIDAGDAGDNVIGLDVNAGWVGNWEAESSYIQDVSDSDLWVSLQLGQCLPGSDHARSNCRGSGAPSMSELFGEW